jgi:hypothetical protein
MDKVKEILKKIGSIIWVNKWYSLLIHVTVVSGVIAFFLYYFFYVYLPETTNHGETITVPDLKGKTLEELPQFLETMEFRFEVADSAYDPEMPPLAVLDQYPEKEKQVKLNRKIYLTINKIEPPMVKFPDIVDSSIESAERILKSVGLKLGKIKFVPDEIPNTVLGVIINEVEIERDQIAEGVEVPKGILIDLEVGSGLRDNQRTVPEVVGMPIEEAEIYLSAYGLAVGHIEYFDTLGVDLGTVIKQNPKAEKGKVIAVGSMVDLWVAGFYPENEMEGGEEEKK